MIALDLSGARLVPRPLRAGAARLLALAAAMLAAALPGPASAREAPPRPVLPAQVRLELRPAVEVAGGDVLLGDLAAVTSTDLGTLERLARLSLGAAPRAGEERLLRRAELAAWIRARTGLSVAELAWSGAAAVSIRSASQRLEAEHLTRRAADALRTALESEGRRVELTVVGRPPELVVPVGSVELRPRPVIPSSARRHAVWLDVWVDARFVRAVAVDFEARTWVQGCVASSAWRSGELVDASCCELGEVEWTGRAGSPAVPAGGERLRVRRPIGAGDAPARHDLEPAPAVSRGERATLRAGQGLVRVESTVEVLQDGREGDAVRVRAPHARADIVARVTGAGLVEVAP